MQELIQKGFRECAMGGNIRALVRHRSDGNTDVATGIDGDLPETDNWLLVTYKGDWLENPDAEELSVMDHESSPVHLFEAVDL